MNMLNIKKILYVIVATACGSFLLFGCVKKESSSLGERHNVTVQLNVGTRAVSESNETPTPEESALHSLRVYAFVDGRLAGYYFNNGSMEAPAIFLIGSYPVFHYDKRREFLCGGQRGCGGDSRKFKTTNEKHDGSRIECLLVHPIKTRHTGYRCSVRKHNR